MTTAPTPPCRDSEERYRSLFESSMDAIVTTDVNGKILMANQAAEGLFGFAGQDIKAENFREFYADPPNNVKCPTPALKAWIGHP